MRAITFPCSLSLVTGTQEVDCFEVQRLSFCNHDDDLYPAFENKIHKRPSFTCVTEGANPHRFWGLPLKRLFPDLALGMYVCEEAALSSSFQKQTTTAGGWRLPQAPLFYLPRPASPPSPGLVRYCNATSERAGCLPSASLPTPFRQGRGVRLVGHFLRGAEAEAGGNERG